MTTSTNYTATAYDAVQGDNFWGYSERINTEVALRKSKFPLKLLQAAAKTGSNSCAYDMKENHEDK